VEQGIVWGEMAHRLILLAAKTSDMAQIFSVSTLLVTGE
jgi:hypothetical protein